MEFKVIEPGGFLHGAVRLKENNTHDSDDFDDMTEEHVMAFHRAGWVSIEGVKDNQRDIHHSEVIADSTLHGHKASEAG